MREARRRHRYVAEALAAAGVVPVEVALAISSELDDALAARGLLEPNAFRGRVFPVEDAVAAPTPDVVGAAHWLEAEIERHVDLVADFDPIAHPDAGRETIRILSGPVGAFEAAGVLGPARSLLLDLAASLSAAGFDTGGGGDDPEWISGKGRVRREWVGFLRARPSPISEAVEPDQVRECRLAMGELAGASVTLTAVGWSTDRIDATVTIGRRVIPQELPGPETAIWLARAIDGRGRIHLGQPARHRGDATRTLTFGLRPGLTDDATSDGAVLEVRVTAGSERVQATLEL